MISVKAKNFHAFSYKKRLKIHIEKFLSGPIKHKIQELQELQLVNTNNTLNKKILIIFEINVNPVRKLVPNPINNMNGVNRREAERLKDDYELLKELNTNPNRAMESIIEQYTGLVYSIINSKISSVGTAEDVKECVSDVFMEFYRKARQIDTAVSSIKGLLIVIAKYKGIDLFRSLAGTAGRNINMDETYEQLADTKLNPEQEVILKEQRKFLLQAIGSLGEPDREIFIRKYFLGQRTKEIAEALYLRDNTVDKKISRGLKKLRILLGGVVHEGAEDNLLTK